MNADEVFKFIDAEGMGVIATVGEERSPEAALMGLAATPELELVFDTVKSSRKFPNLKSNSRVAFVIGCTTEVTVQYEGCRRTCRRRPEKVPESLFREIQRRPDTTRMAGHNVLCGSANVD